MRRRLLLVLCLSLLLPVGVADAYTVIRQNNGNSTTWSSNTIKWSISTNTMSDMTPDAIQEALQGAMDAWKAVSCSKATFSYKGFKGSDPQNGIHVTFKENSWDPSVGDALAYSVSDTNWGGTIQSNDVVVNAKDSQWSNTGSWGTNDLQGVITHEVGHSLGLDHSRDFEATMFFSGGSLKIRTLEEDDERGLCFLYPTGTFTQGLPCDACDASSNCQYGYCWGVGGGHAYCGANCTSSAQCAKDFECATLDNNVEKQCWPKNGYCNQYGQNVPLGEFCFGHAVCETGICLSMKDKAICSKECSNPNQCPEDFGCSGGFCMPSGSSPYGAECEQDEECETAMCVSFAIGSGVCTTTCGEFGGSCPVGHQCLNDQICVPPGPSPNGTPCGLQTQCMGTYCIDNVCTQACHGALPCPDGTTCVGGYCEGLATGGTCETAQTCPPGMICQSDGPGLLGSCQYDCNPLGGFGCPEDQVCEWRWEASTESIKGRCVPKNGGQLAGESCAELPCENDLVCDAQFGPQPLCRKDCKNDTGNDLGCGVLEDCLDLGDPEDPLKGLCVKENEEPPPDAGPGVDAGGTTGDASQPPQGDEAVAGSDSVMPEALGAEIPKKKKKGDHSACGLADSSRVPWLWAPLFGLLWVRRRSRMGSLGPTQQP